MFLPVKVYKNIQRQLPPTMNSPSQQSVLGRKCAEGMDKRFMRLPYGPRREAEPVKKKGRVPH